MKRLSFSLAILLSCITSSASEPPKRPRIFAIAEVQIFVSDLPASSDFYINVLNIMRPFNCPSCGKTPLRRFSVNGVQIVSLSPSGSRAQEDRMEEISFATNDVPALRRYLEFYKIHISNPHKPIDNYLSLTDPEGHKISFQQFSGDFPMRLGVSDPPPGLIHAGIIVHDRAVEDRFYKDILGFHLYWHGGMKEDQTDWVDMQVPEGTDWIEYMLNVPVNADRHTRGVMNHFALGVKDIHAAQKQLLDHGVKLTEEPQIGKDGKWQLNLYDPDDTRVELMEFKPTNKPCCSSYTGPHPGP